jgi:hypothetical protein
MAAVYKGKLELDRIVGVRHDKGQRLTSIQNFVKPSAELPKVQRSMKTAPNTTPNGEKYS